MLQSDDGSSALSPQELRRLREEELRIESLDPPRLARKEHEPITCIHELLCAAQLPAIRHVVLSSRLKSITVHELQNTRLSSGRGALLKLLEAHDVRQQTERELLATTLARASRQGRVHTKLQLPPPSLPPASPSSRIAFLFLIRDRIEQEALWLKFFAGAARGQYSVFVHAKTAPGVRPLAPFFEACRLPPEECVPTEYAHISLVHAQNALLRAALRDPSNCAFAFVSGACVPVKPFSHVHSLVVDGGRSRFSCMDFDESDCKLQEELLAGSATHLRAGRDDQDELAITPTVARKASQWCVLMRPFAAACATMPAPYVSAFDDVRAPEEWYYRTTAHVLMRQGRLGRGDVEEVATAGARTNHRGPTFVNWYEGHGSHPHEYDSITIDELYALVHGPCFFARKFAADCIGLAPLLALLDDNSVTGVGDGLHDMRDAHPSASQKERRTQKPQACACRWAAPIAQGQT